MSVFGKPQVDPPPYPFSRGRTGSTFSGNSMQSQQSHDKDKALPSPPPQYHSVSPSNAVELDKTSLPRDSLVLVTGANGWHGMHVVDQLLEHGYRVRGTVRDAEKAVSISKYFRDKYGPGKFTTVIVANMVERTAFNLAIKGCVGVIHVASVMSFSPDPNEVIAPSIAGALTALEAAATEPSVKRFVYCSASAAAVSHGTGLRGELVTNESWNMADFKAAWEPPPYEMDRAWAVFASSKMQAEQAVWRWYHARRPQFVLNTVLPSMLWGKILDPASQNHHTSVMVLKSIFDGDAAGTAWFPPQYFVDVQDSALLHVAALILPDVKGQRIFAAESPYNISSILQLLRGLYPDRTFEGDVSDHGIDSAIFRDTPKAEQLLRRMGKAGFTDIETSLRRNCQPFLLDTPRLIEAGFVQPARNSPNSG